MEQGPTGPPGSRGAPSAPPAVAPPLSPAAPAAPRFRAPPVPGETPLGALGREVYEWMAMHRPGWATNQGIHILDPFLPDPSPRAIAQELADLGTFQARLPTTPVSDPERTDADALRYFLALREFELRELARWRKDPDFVLEVLDHLFPLLARPFAPLEARLASAASRLEQTPRYLLSARERIVPAEVPALWVRMALESLASAPALLDSILEAGKTVGHAGLTARLSVAVESAKSAFEAHRRWIDTVVQPAAQGTWAIGEAAFDRLLELRLVPYRAKDLVALGDHVTKEHEERLRDAAVTVISAEAVNPESNPIPQAFAIIQKDHPEDFSAVLAHYRNASAAARQFVLDHGIVSLAPNEKLEVMETPGYLRHIIPFAAYMAPGRFDEPPCGIYLVTPKADLTAFANADIRNVTTHEAYPGHHAQLTLANRNPSYARALVEAVEMIEGWALYCEEIMGRHGFTSSPAERFIRARDALFRALRVRLDPGLHIGAVSFEHAVVEMRDALGFSVEEAEAEVKRYTLEPGYAASYMLGKLSILDFRNAWEARGGTERGFHDMLLAQGSLPTALIETVLDTAPIV
ncbi:MAG: DUF885 domain-containing protein [Thermoplasmatota archaeon]